MFYIAKLLYLIFVDYQHFDLQITSGLYYFSYFLKRIKSQKIIFELKK